VVIDFPSSWPTPRPQKHPLTPNPKAKHPKDQRPPPKPQSPRYDQNRPANSEIGRNYYPQQVTNFEAFRESDRSTSFPFRAFLVSQLRDMRTAYFLGEQNFGLKGEKRRGRRRRISVTSLTY